MRLSVRTPPKLHSGLRQIHTNVPAWTHRTLGPGDWAEVDSLQCHLVRWQRNGKGVVFKAGPGPLMVAICSSGGAHTHPNTVVSDGKNILRCFIPLQTCRAVGIQRDQTEALLALQGYDGVVMDRRKGNLRQIVSNITAAVSAWWAKCWMADWEKPLREGLPPLYYDPFVRQLVEYGRHILACGGGVISEPDRAIKELKGRYGQAGLCDRCFALVFEQPPDAEYPEGIVGTAWGILYRLGDDAMLQKLLEMRDRLQQLAPATPPAEEWRPHAPLDRYDQLIAGLCHRLHQPLPEGVTPLTDEDIFYLFN